MVLVRQNKGAKIILHAKSPTFRAAKLQGFTVLSSFHRAGDVDCVCCQVHGWYCVVQRTARRVASDATNRDEVRSRFHDNARKPPPDGQQSIIISTGSAAAAAADH